MYTPVSLCVCVCLWGHLFIHLCGFGYKFVTPSSSLSFPPAVFPPQTTYPALVGTGRTNSHHHPSTVGLRVSSHACLCPALSAEGARDLILVMSRFSGLRTLLVHRWALDKCCLIEMRCLCVHAGFYHGQNQKDWAPSVCFLSHARQFTKCLLSGGQL